MMKKWVIRNKGLSLSQWQSLPKEKQMVLKLLYNRGIKEPCQIDAFLNPSLDKLYSCFLLPDINKAAERIKTALAKKEKILLFGDYDVDGVTSLAVFSKFLQSRNAEFSVFIPHRIFHGYGFNKQAVDFALREGIKLIITLDCGSNSPWVDYAYAKGIDVIVIDHHEVSESRKHFALVNPKQGKSQYPFKSLSACGVAFKVIEAVAKRFWGEFLDLVALSTVCDVVPLIGENRILVKFGLEKMKESPCLGIEALMETASLKKNNLSAFHLGWILGPRLNASGRVDSAKISYSLLMADDKGKALELARRLEENNNARRRLTDEVYSLAVAQLEEHTDWDRDFVLVSHGNNWHLGVLGIVASRIKEKYCRPAVLISFDENNIGKGSARSVDNFHITEALLKCRGVLEKVGGHKKAAGLEIKKANVEEFKKSLNLAAKQVLEGGDLSPVLFIDEILDFKDLTESFAGEVLDFSPFGEDNPEPLFISKNARLKNRSAHYSRQVFWIEQSGRIMPGFLNSPDLEMLISYTETFDLVYSLRLDSKLGIVLKIKDIRQPGPL